jgi:hypothetical protein
MKYFELLWTLDLLAKYYPRYYTTDLFILAEDIFKWLNDELPEDSSTLIYLQSCFESPTDALKTVWKEIQLLAGAYENAN